jgi:hypothetical protein
MTPKPTPYPAQRICEILDTLRAAVQQSISDIMRIADGERLRHGDDTLEGLAWCDFGAGLHSDVARAARHIEWEIAAMRGSLLYRGLDSNRQEGTQLPGTQA